MQGILYHGKSKKLGSDLLSKLWKMKLFKNVIEKIKIMFGFFPFFLTSTC